MIAKLIEEVAKLIAAIAVMFWKMNVNYLMMILPAGIHIEFHKKNHPDNMGIAGIDNRHIQDNIQNVVEEHTVVVEEHTVAVEEHTVDEAAEAVSADIDNKHIQDAIDVDAVGSVEENIEGSMQLGFPQ